MKIIDTKTKKKRHVVCIKTTATPLELLVCIEASKIRAVSQQRLSADGVIIDLPGKIMAIKSQ